ncbi:PaaI family thioesterase [Pontiella sulfatireligans]|uniref:Acyl-coenzyme A thioesterase THEM4 n=1 Tax=Pontiella sulfatireligans TaxID=2750658 RepID=A0A6C2UIB0_9BACT|nr:PaaI family thioesterase [Pontiella sulfatireligans]VGO19952.1 hypothetical protein SCARR_02012 [Pontiella sulfatireligans]
MPENGHRHCLLCGDLNSGSFGLKFTPHDDGGVRAVFHGHEGLQGYDGILHGGVIASLLDSAMTHCLFKKGVKAVTADLNVRYKHSIPCGEQVDVQAWLVKCHPPLYCLKASLLLGGRTMAHGEARFMHMQEGDARVFGEASNDSSKKNLTPEIQPKEKP